MRTSHQYRGSVHFQCVNGGTKRERPVAQAHLRLGDPRYADAGGGDGDGDVPRVPQYVAHRSKRVHSLNLHIPRPTWILRVIQSLAPHPLGCYLPHVRTTGSGCMGFQEPPSAGTPPQACQNACQLTL